MLMFCVIINAFTATFDQFNTFLLRKKRINLTPIFWIAVYLILRMMQV